MLKYTISVLYLFGIVLQAQTEEEVFIANDSVLAVSEISKPINQSGQSTKKKGDFKYSIRLGADVSKPIISYFSNDYDGYEFVGDLRVAKMFYIAIEIGSEKKNNTESFFDFSSSGNYYRIGLDWNLYSKRFFLENMVYLGFRYSAASFNQNVTRYQVYSKNQYWEESNTLGSNSSILKIHENLSQDWIEIIFGIKGEIFNHLYLGISVRVFSILSVKESEFFPNLWVPGYNEVTSDNSFSVGFNYTISYQIRFANRYKKTKLLNKKTKPVY